MSITRLWVPTAAALLAAGVAAAPPPTSGIEDRAAAFALRSRAGQVAAADGDVAALEAQIPDGAQGEAWTLARARLLHLRGRHAEAAALLEPLTRPRHHTRPRWAIVHADLGDAYAALGRSAAAEGQWRVALATESSPDGSGWDPDAVEAKLEAAAAAQDGAAPVVPVTLYPDAIYLIDLASLRRTEAGVRYEKVELLLQDDDGAAFSRFAREMDCGDEPQVRAEWRRRYGADGRPVKAPALSPEWRHIRYDDPWLHSERRLVCGLDAETRFRPDESSDLERLRAFRAGAGGES
jgi:hypothetical protein